MLELPDIRFGTLWLLRRIGTGMTQETSTAITMPRMCGIFVWPSESRCGGGPIWSKPKCSEIHQSSCVQENWRTWPNFDGLNHLMTNDTTFLAVVYAEGFLTEPSSASFVENCWKDKTSAFCQIVLFCDSVRISFQATLPLFKSCKALSMWMVPWKGATWCLKQLNTPFEETDYNFVGWNPTMMKQNDNL